MGEAFDDHLQRMFVALRGRILAHQGSLKLEYGKYYPETLTSSIIMLFDQVGASTFVYRPCRGCQHVFCFYPRTFLSLRNLGALSYPVPAFLAGTRLAGILDLRRSAGQGPVRSCFRVLVEGPRW